MAKCYIVSFETATEATRLKITERLKALGGYCPITKWTWAIVTEFTATQVRKHLADLIVAPDRLFVVRSGTEAAWRNSYGDKNNEWLKKYL